MTRPDDMNSADALSAYLDRELAPERHAELERRLADDSDLARRLDTLGTNDELLRQALAFKVIEPVPERLTAALSAGRGTARRWAIAGAVAAGTVLFLAGGATGWWIGQSHALVASASAVARWETAATDAMLAHKLYAAQVNRPVEVADEGRPEITRWLSKNLGLQLILPTMEAEGYRRLGVRLLPAGGDVAALVMYEGPRGDRVSIYMRNGQAGESSIRRAEKGDQEAFYWVDDGCAYVVTGLVPRDQLLRMAHAAFDQMEGRSG